jgi:hypothetical protein
MKRGASENLPAPNVTIRVPTPVGIGYVFDGARIPSQNAQDSAHGYAKVGILAEPLNFLSRLDAPDFSMNKESGFAETHRDFAQYRRQASFPLGTETNSTRPKHRLGLAQVESTPPFDQCLSLPQNPV